MSSRSSKVASRTRPPPPADLTQVGSTLAGKYRLVRALGQGGMGTVYKAENVPIGKVVAIKLLHHNLTADPIAMQRFQREARATVAIAHPNIVDVLDMGEDGGGAPFLVMEYVRGASLKRLLGQGPLSVERAARIAGQILDALAAAHDRGIVHRDLKPENILLTARDGEHDFVKVVDFGISTFADSVAQREREADLTPTGLTMATPFYASPEQIRGANGRDPRVDIYAVGVLLYEMLAGHRPFHGSNLPELCTRILLGEVAPLEVFRKDVPRAFEAIVRRAFASAVDARFQSARELAMALVPFGARMPRASSTEPTDTFTVDLRQLGQPAPSTRPPAGEHAGEAAARVSEALRHSLLAYFGGRFGAEAVERTLSSLDLATQRALAPAACEAAALGRALAALDRAFGSGDRAEIAKAGRAFARQVLRERTPPESITPELFFSLSAELWQRHFGLGEARVQRVGRGYGRLEIAGGSAPARPPSPLALLIVMLGLLDEGLRRAGGRGRSVRLAACTAFGDELDAFEATWSG